MEDTLPFGGEQPLRVLLVDDDSMVRGWVRLAP
jgi:hypothetical protein